MIGFTESELDVLVHAATQKSNPNSENLKAGLTSLKNDHNGFRFLPQADTVYCTNSVITFLQVGDLLIPL